MSAILAEKEKSPTVPFVPASQSDLKRELIEYCNKLDVETHLRAYNAILTHMPKLTSQPNLQYHLLLLDTNKPSITVSSYSSDNLEKAFQDYSEMEDTIKNQTGMDTVLVSAKSINELKRSFPNYFVDTHRFLTEVQKAVR